MGNGAGPCREGLQATRQFWHLGKDRGKEERLGRRTLRWQGSPEKVLSRGRGATEQRSPIRRVPFGARIVYNRSPAVHRHELGVTCER